MEFDETARRIAAAVELAFAGDPGDAAREDFRAEQERIIGEAAARAREGIEWPTEKDGDFAEDLHPRDDSGKWAPKGGGTASKMPEDQRAALVRSISEQPRSGGGTGKNFPETFKTTYDLKNPDGSEGEKVVVEMRRNGPGAYPFILRSFPGHERDAYAGVLAAMEFNGGTLSAAHLIPDVNGLGPNPAPAQQVLAKMVEDNVLAVGEGEHGGVEYRARPKEFWFNGPSVADLYRPKWGKVDPPSGPDVDRMRKVFEKAKGMRNLADPVRDMKGNVVAEGGKPDVTADLAAMGMKKEAAAIAASWMMRVEDEDAIAGKFLDGTSTRSDDTTYREHVTAKVNEWNKNVAPKRDLPKVAVPGGAASMKDMIIAEYLATQDAMKTAGQEEMVLYRGVADEQASDLALEWEGGESKVKVTTRALSSWSINPIVARRFGPVVVKATVPRERILASWEHSSSFSSGALASVEKEVIVWNPDDDLEVSRDAIEFEGSVSDYMREVRSDMEAEMEEEAKKAARKPVDLDAGRNQNWLHRSEPDLIAAAFGGKR